MAEILDGKTLSKRILEKVKEQGKKLSLAIVLVGGSPASRSFIKQKEKACELASVELEKIEFTKEISQKKLSEEVKKIAERNSGAVVQLPLPSRFDSQAVLNSIPEKKDPDVLSKKAFEAFKSGRSLILPPVVGAVNHFFKENNILLENKKVALVGEGRLVGRPLAAWLERKGADYFIVRENGENSKNLLTKADIIISGVGKPNIIKGKNVKEGAVVIDAGTSLEQGQLAGDVAFKEVAEKASYITPVPGGLGPLTVACLLENLLKLNQ